MGDLPYNEEPVLRFLELSTRRYPCGKNNNIDHVKAWNSLEQKGFATNDQYRGAVLTPTGRKALEEIGK